MLWDYTCPTFVGLQKSIFCGTTHSTHVLTYVNTQVSNFVGLQKSILCDVQVWTLQSHNCGHCVVPQNMDFCSPTTVGHVLLSVVPQVWTL